MSPWQYHPVLIIFQLGGLISIGVAAYCTLYVRQHGWSYLVASVGLLAFHNAIWNVAATLKVASTSLAAKLLFYKLEFLGSAVNPSVAIVIALAYVGYDRWLTRRTVLALAVVPAVSIPLIFVNPGGVMLIDPTLVPVGDLVALEHEFPPLFTAFLAWALGAALLAVILVTHGGIRGSNPTGPAALIGLALLLPIIVVSLKVAGIYPPSGDGINVTPAANTLSLVFVAVAITRYQLFELLPVARDRAIDVMQDGYLLIDADDVIVDANRLTRELLTGSPTGAVTDRPATDLIPAYEELGATREPVAFSTNDRIVQALSSPIERGSKIVGRVVVLHDVTTRREQERALERKNRRLEDVVDVVSHDLRNPLTVAKGHLGLAREDPGSDHLDEVDHALDRMERLIEDLLAETRAEPGVSGGERQPIELASIVDASWRNVATADAAIAVEVTGEVMGVRSRVAQLLENLFRNAVEHGGDGVTVTVGDLPNGFFVEDDGPGIPPEHRDRVLEEGFSTNPAGTGIGLSIVSDIAADHGWSVRVQDGDDGGARFEFTGVTVDR